VAKHAATVGYPGKDCQAELALVAQ